MAKAAAEWHADTCENYFHNQVINMLTLQKFEMNIKTVSLTEHWIKLSAFLDPAEPQGLKVFRPPSEHECTLYSTVEAEGEQSPPHPSWNTTTYIRRRIYNIITGA